MKKVDLTQGKVFNVILALAIPLVVSSLLQFMYNFVNMIWVGGLGSNAVASIGSSSFYISMGYSINALVVVGAGVKVSHAIGRKNQEESNKYINTAFVINIALGVLFSIVILAFGKNFIDFLGINNSDVREDALSYLLISGSAMIIVFFNTLFLRLFSSFGNNKVSLLISSIGLVVNILLDPIFIYTLGLGVNGAAIATVIANSVVLIMSIYISRSLYTLGIRKYFDIKMFNEIFKLGLPNAAQRVIFTMINIFIAKIIAIYGADAIAAQKIGFQIETIVFIIISGFNGATASFVGQNYGAKKLDRISKGYNMSLLVGMGYTFLITIMLLLIPESLAKIFVKEPETIKITANYLRIIGLSQVFVSIEMITNGAFLGLGATKYAAVISISLTVIRLPIALIMSKYLGVNGVWWSIAVSSILKGVVSYIVYKFILWKKVEKEMLVVHNSGFSL